MRQSLLYEMTKFQSFYMKIMKDDYSNVLDRLDFIGNGIAPPEKWMESYWHLNVAFNCYQRPILCMSENQVEHHLPARIPVQDWKSEPIFILYQTGRSHFQAARIKSFIDGDSQLLLPPPEIHYLKGKNMLEPDDLVNYFNNSPVYSQVKMVLYPPLDGIEGVYV